MKKVAVILSGSGFLDGAEITESVSLFLSLSEFGAEVQVFSLEKEIPSINHLTLEPNEARSMIKEASRITRGKVSNLSELNSAHFDAIALPGGFGVAKHFCEFAEKGASSRVDPLVRKVIETFHSEQKPILALCIAPALISLCLGQHSPTLTIGNDDETAKEIEKTGALHENCPVTDFVSDRENKIISSPAYMYDSAKPFEVYQGIRSATKEFLEMA